MIYTFMGVRWPGATVAILASGPSLSTQQCDAVREWRAGDPERRKVIAINTTFRLAPWADLLYACDVTWWERYHAEVLRTFQGELWSQDRNARDCFNVRYIESAPGRGLSLRPALIHQGQNSGSQTINLAFHAGVRRMLLLGFDMHAEGGTHWHGDHPLPLTNPKPYLFEAYKKHLGQIAHDLRNLNVSVVNCSPGSKLECFPKADLLAALAEEALT